VFGEQFRRQGAEFIQQSLLVHFGQQAVAHHDFAIDDHGFDRTSVLAIDQMLARIVERNKIGVAQIHDHEIGFFADFERADTFDSDEAYETALVTTLLTGVLGLRGFSGSSRARTKNDLENVALFEAVKKFDITNKRIDAMVESEAMSKEDAVMVKDHLKEAKTVLDGLPSEFTGDQKTQLVSLLIEKKKLKEQDSKSYKDEKFEATKTAEINAQIAEIDKIIDKVMVDKAAKVGDPVTDEQKGEPRLEITNVGEDVEYKVNDNFFSEKDLKENLASPEFIEKIKNGEVQLSVNNPSPAIQEIIEASGLVKTEQDVATQEEAQSEAGEITTPATETKPTEATKEEVKPDSKVSEDAPPVESKKSQIEDDLEKSRINKLEKQQTEKNNTPLTDLEYKKAEKIVERGIENGLSGKEIFVKLRNAGFVNSKDVGAGHTQTYLQSRVDGTTSVKLGETTSQVKTKHDAKAPKQEVVPKAEREEFIDKGTVTEERISSIADKVKNNEELSQAETEIFTDKTTEVNEKIAETTPKAEAKVTETVESLGETSVAPMANPKVFEAVTSLAKEIAVEKGLKGVKLKTALSEKVEELSGGKISKADVAEAFSEINQSVPKTAKAIKEAKTEKVKVSKGRAMAEKVRDKKFEDAFSSMGTLSINVPGLFKQAINTSLEAAAITLEATAKVSEAVSSGIKNLKGTEWYKGLPSESKTKAEKEFKKIFEAQSAEVETGKADPKKEEKKEPKKPVSSIADRRARGANISKEAAAKLEKAGEFDVVNQKDTVDAAEAVVKDLGAESSVEFAKDPKNKLKPAVKFSILMESSLALSREAATLPEGSKEKADMETRALEITIEVSQERTEEGQAAAMVNEFIKRNPELAKSRRINEILFDERNNALKQDVGNGRVGKEVVESMRETIREEVKNAVKDDLKILKERNKRLEKQVQDISKKLENGKESVKKRKQRSKEAIKADWDFIFRKDPNAPGPTGGLILLSSIPTAKISAVGRIITEMVKYSGLSTRQIINDVVSTLKKGGIKATKEDVEAIANNSPEFNEAKEFEGKLSEDATDQEIQDAIKQEIKDRGQKISDIVSQHYTSIEGTSKDLANSLVDKAGLSKSDASSLAKKIELEMAKIVKEKADQELERMMRPNEGISPETKKQRKENAKITNKVIRAVNLGALNSVEFTNAFASKFGFREISARQQAEVLSLVNIIEAHERGVDPDTGLNMTEKELKRKATLKLNNLINDMKPRDAAFWGNLFMEMNYTNVLSGMNTQVNANAGAMATSIINVTAVMLKNLPNARGVGFGIMKSLSPTTLRASSARAREARKKNFSMYDSINTLSEGTPTDSQGYYERQILEGVQKYVKKLQKDPGLLAKSKNTLKLLHAAFVQPLRLVHLLKASDAFLTSQYSEFMNSIDEYNATAKEMGAGRIEKMFGSKRLVDTVNKKMAWDQVGEFKRIAEAEIELRTRDIENEVDAKIEKGEIKPGNRKSEIRKEKGRTISKGYKARRVKELQENQRNEATLEESIKTVREWIMLTQPDGIIGEGVRLMQGATKISEGDSGAKVVAKSILGSTFMFIRMTGNFFNAIKTGIPIYGAFDAVIGVTRDTETDKRTMKKWKGNTALMHRRLAINAIISTASAMLYAHMWKWDEEEEEYILNPDRIIDFTSTGTGNFGENQRLEPGHQNFGWRLRSDDGTWGPWRKSNLFPQAMGTIGVLGRMADDDKGLSDPEKAQAREESIFASIKSGFLDTPFSAFMEGSFVSVGKIGKTVMRSDEVTDGLLMAGLDLASQPVKNVMQPNAYKDIVNEVRANNEGVNRATPRSFVDKFLYDMYGMDFYQKEKTDMFGNNYPKQTKYSQWVDGYYGTYKDHPEVQLLYKFGTGVNITAFKPDKEYNVMGQTITLTDTQKEKIEETQKKVFKETVLDNLELLESLETKIELEDAMKIIKSVSVKTAKNEMFEEHFLNSK